MPYTDLERTTPGLKVAGSRFILLDSLSTNPLSAEINWDDVAEAPLSDCCYVIVALSKSCVTHFYDIIHFYHHTIPLLSFDYEPDRRKNFTPKPSDPVSRHRLPNTLFLK
jgi:hypothetical protein